jgi:hypothetical protein
MCTFIYWSYTKLLSEGDYYRQIYCQYKVLVYNECHFFITSNIFFVNHKGRHKVNRAFEICFITARKHIIYCDDFASNVVSPTSTIFDIWFMTFGKRWPSRANVCVSVILMYYCLQKNCTLLARARKKLFSQCNSEIEPSCCRLTP